ncbi:hypothetical protein K1719_034618 [Acacia pycnantha]|nr:hypothetical protein K1719_034618 [Acacia pycnantha]
MKFLPLLLINKDTHEPPTCVGSVRPYLALIEKLAGKERREREKNQQINQCRQNASLGLLCLASQEFHLKTSERAMQHSSASSSSSLQCNYFDKYFQSSGGCKFGKACK